MNISRRVGQTDMVGHNGVKLFAGLNSVALLRELAFCTDDLKFVNLYSMQDLSLWVSQM